MVSRCCLSGFQWEGTPSGTESTLADNKTYTAGLNSDVAIMVVADLFGWTFINERLLCDHYAEEANATVYMPDFFGGEVIPPDIAKDPRRWGEFDHAGFVKRNARDVRWPEIEVCAKALKASYKRVGVIGYCFGGWAGFQLGSSMHTPRLVDCVSIAHPTWLTEEDINNIDAPVQIVAPEKDPTFTPALKKHANGVIPTKGIPYDYQYFPGQVHGFATRGDPDEKGERASMMRAKRAQVAWMREWLHGIAE